MAVETQVQGGATGGAVNSAQANSPQGDQNQGVLQAAQETSQPQPQQRSTQQPASPRPPSTQRPSTQPSPQPSPQQPAPKKPEVAPPPPPGGPDAGKQPASQNSEKSGSSSRKPTSSRKTVLRIILGICLFTLVLTLGYAVYHYFTFPYTAPLNARVTNVTSRSATVSWVTEEPTQGIVIYSDSDFFFPWIFSRGGKSLAYDDRDVTQARREAAAREFENYDKAEDSSAEINYSDIDEEVIIEEVGEYYVHHVTLRDLDPEKTYYFRVGNGLRFAKVAEGDDENEFTVAEGSSFTTYHSLEEITVPDPTYGLVESGDEVVDDGAIFMMIDGLPSSPLSAVLAENGSWYIDLSNARSIDGERLTGFDETFTETMYVEGGPLGSSGVIENPMSVDAPADIIDLGSSSTEEESEVEGASSSKLVSQVYAGECECDCNVSNGQYSDQYCGETGTKKEQTIDGDCYQVIEHCNAIYNGISCERDRPYFEKGKMLRNGPCSGSDTGDETPEDDDTGDDTGGGGAICTGEDAKYVNANCGNNGVCICTKSSVGGYCRVRGQRGEIKANLCLGSAMVRCCEPIDQEPASDRGGCGRERCGPKYASCYDSGEYGGWDADCTWMYCNKSGGWERVYDCCASHEGRNS